MASIVQRGPAQWQVTIRRKGYDKQVKTFETKRDASDWAAVAESEMARGVFINRAQLERLTMADLLARYSEEVVASHLGARQEQARVKRWLSHPLAKRVLAALQPLDFVDYRNERRAEGASIDSVRLELALITALFSHARSEWGLPVENVASGVKLPASPGRDRRPVGDELDRILAACSTADRPQELRAAIELAVETGIRRDRLARLRWEQVDFRESVVWIFTKARADEQKRMPVPLSEKALQILRDLPRSLSGQVFQYDDGNKLGQAFRRVCDKAGVKGLRFHDLRHEAASRLAPHMPAATLCKIMGWKTMQMSLRYYNPSASELVAAIRRAA